MATELPARSSTATDTTKRSNPVRCPKLLAMSSPRANVFSERPTARAKTNPAASRGKTGHTKDKGRPSTLPAIQNMTDCKPFSLRINSPDVSDEMRADIAAPAKVSLSGVGPSLPTDAMP